MKSIKFGAHYTDWREVRIKKIIQILGKDSFKGKTLLELGCGYGDIGREFEKLGAIVTYAEGRKEHLDMVKKLYPKAHTVLLDQDAHWEFDKKFDIIIHMGVLYHLENWKEDLTRTLKHSDLVVLESQVIDSLSDKCEIRMDEFNTGDDQALHGIAVRTSAPHIEKHITELGATFTRYDDSDLNSPPHIYNWTSTLTGRNIYNMLGRRFWIIKK